jgi:multidrug efflux pump subunit AcrA (membrane-fusion protein)
MYAYATVPIERKGVWAVPRSALDYSGDKTFYWTHDNGKAVRTEVHTGVANDEWVEVIRRRLPGRNGSDGWAAIDGTESVIVGDLSILADGEAVRVTEGSDKK